jgi:hypothetical protein
LVNAHINDLQRNAFTLQFRSDLHQMGARFGGRRPGCVKTQALNLRVENPS